jgi:hypothetical protein
MHHTLAACWPLVHCRQMHSPAAAGSCSAFKRVVQLLPCKQAYMHACHMGRRCLRLHCVGTLSCTKIKLSRHAAAALPLGEFTCCCCSCSSHHYDSLPSSFECHGLGACLLVLALLAMLFAGHRRHAHTLPLHCGSREQKHKHNIAAVESRNINTTQPKTLAGLTPHNCMEAATATAADYGAKADVLTAIASMSCQVQHGAAQDQLLTLLPVQIGLRLGSPNAPEWLHNCCRGFISCSHNCQPALRSSHATETAYVSSRVSPNA